MNNEKTYMPRASKMQQKPKSVCALTNSQGFSYIHTFLCVHTLGFSTFQVSILWGTF